MGCGLVGVVPLIREYMESLPWQTSRRLNLVPDPGVCILILLLHTHTHTHTHTLAITHKQQPPPSLPPSSSFIKKFNMATRSSSSSSSYFCLLPLFLHRLRGDYDRHKMAIWSQQGCLSLQKPSPSQLSIMEFLPQLQQLVGYALWKEREVSDSVVGIERG